MGWAVLKFSTRLLAAGVLLIATQFAQGAGPVSFSETFHSYDADLPVSIPFKAWAPANWDHLKGVIFSIPGHGGDTRDITNNTGWQQRLAEMGFAIVGVQYTEVPGGGNIYVGTYDYQIRDNMQTMLDGMADALGHPELSNAPIFPYGISHGSGMTTLVAEGFADRTLGYFADKGAYTLSAQLPPSFKDTPGLMVFGSYDTTVPPSGINGIYQSFRFDDAEVAQGVDWFGHADTSPNWRYAFIDEVIKARYPAGQLPSLTPGNPLQLVDEPFSSGWLVEPNTVDPFSEAVTQIEWPDIDPADGYAGFVQGRSWVPSELMAMVLRAHNSVPAGISKQSFAMNVGVPLSGGPELSVVVNFTGLPYTGIDIYDESGLIAEMGPGFGLHEIPYLPTERGNQTFVAVAEYMYNGQPHFASTYVTYNVTELASLLGDYNGNGTVDAADYTAWRDALTASATLLLNDPTPGIVDESDFLYWRDHFGETSGSGSGSNSAAVPEPASALLLTIAAVLLGTRHRS